MRPWPLAILFLVGPLAMAACTPVEGDRILGEHFAAAHAAFTGMDPAVDMAPAPSAGARRTFLRFELEHLAGQHGVALAANAPSACFERATFRLELASLTPILRQALDSQPRTAEAHLEILDFSQNPLPLGALEFRLENLDASGLWRGRLVYGDKRSVPIWARVRVTGAAIGKVLATWRPVASPAIQRGDAVQVEVSSGAVRLAFEAAAESSGHVGELVTVRNPANGERVRGVVEAQGKVGIRK